MGLMKWSLRNDAIILLFVSYLVTCVKCILLQRISYIHIKTNISCRKCVCVCMDVCPSIEILHAKLCAVYCNKINKQWQPSDGNRTAAARTIWPDFSHSCSKCTRWKMDATNRRWREREREKPAAQNCKEKSMKWVKLKCQAKCLYTK